MSGADEARFVVWPPNHTELSAGFRTWAGVDSDLRVFFTPDVLVGVDAPTRRGYVFDDGWTVEVWIERGLEDLLDLLSADYLSEHCQVERPPEDTSTHRALLELALTKGSAIDEVGHLI